MSADNERTPEEIAAMEEKLAKDQAERDRQDLAAVPQSQKQQTSADENDLVDQLLAIRQMLLGSRETVKDGATPKKKIRALVISAILEDSDSPAVVYHGDEVVYTALSVQVATELRNRVIKKISGSL